MLGRHLGALPVWRNGMRRTYLHGFVALTVLTGLTAVPAEAQAGRMADAARRSTE